MKHYTLSKNLLENEEVKIVHYTSKPDLKALNSPKYIILHHTRTHNTLEKVVNYFKKSKNESSIGYHIMIGKNGQYYMTRPLDKQGTHTKYYDASSIGIGIFGDFNKKEPTQKQIESLKKIFTLLKKKYGVKQCLSHTQAIYELLKKKSAQNLPEFKDETIESDISYYEFLKEVSSIVSKQNNDELKEIFNEMKSCPGINLQKKIKKIGL